MSDASPCVGGGMLNAVPTARNHNDRGAGRFRGQIQGDARMVNAVNAELAVRALLNDFLVILPFRTRSAIRPEGNLHRFAGGTDRDGQQQKQRKERFS